MTHRQTQPFIVKDILLVIPDAYGVLELLEEIGAGAFALTRPDQQGLEGAAHRVGRDHRVRVNRAEEAL